MFFLIPDHFFDLLFLEPDFFVVPLLATLVGDFAFLVAAFLVGVFLGFVEVFLVPDEDFLVEGAFLVAVFLVADFFEGDFLVLDFLTTAVSPPAAGTNSAVAVAVLGALVFLVPFLPELFLTVFFFTTLDFLGLLAVFLPVVIY